MPTPFQPYKPTDSRSLLSNPFAENQIGGSAFGTKPVGDSGILIKTKDPIITTKKPFTFTNPSQSEWESRKKLNENLIKTKEDAEKSWWAKKTKNQKTMIIGGSVLAVAVIGYLAYKKYSKKG
jgi:hypothetical protein